MLYVVLGMHKSGTTLLSQILHHSGIDMGEIPDGVSYDKGNKYEDQESFRINMELIHAPDDEILYVPAPDPLEATEDQRKRMRAFVERRTAAAAGGDWGFKDPRTTLVYPLWDREMPEHKVIAMWRRPEEIWPRFQAPGPKLYYQEPKRAWHYVLRWCEHNERMAQWIRETDHDHLVLNYTEFMTGDEEFRRLQDFIGRPLDDRRRKDLYRSKRKTHPSYEIAKRLVKMRTGKDPDVIIEELERLRKSSPIRG